MAYGKSFRMEAEDFGFRFNMFEKAAPFASGDSLLFTNPLMMALALSRFGGESGHYDVVVHYLASAKNGATFSLGAGSSQDSFRFNESDDPAYREGVDKAQLLMENVQLNRGDLVQMLVQPGGREFAAIDFIEFISVDNPAKAADEAENASGMNAFEQKVLDLTNAYRQKNGLPELRIDEKLSAAAEAHAQDMAENNFFGHISSNGDRVGTRVAEADYDADRVGENIAAGYDTPEEAVEAWIKSPGHRANLLYSKFDEIGVAFVDDNDSRYGEYWVQVFADEIA